MNPIPLEILFYTGAVGLVAIGITGILTSRHLFRVVLSLAIAEAGANLLLVLSGFKWDSAAPILLEGMPANAPMVDPVPQALVLTAIVIGVGIQALAVALLIRVQRAYGTLDIRKLTAQLEQEITEASGVAPDRGPDQPRGKQPFPPPAAAEQKGAGA